LTVILYVDAGKVLENKRQEMQASFSRVFPDRHSF